MKSPLESLEKNAFFLGARLKYRCWEVRYAALGGITARDIICITCYVSLPMQYHFLTISWHSDIEGFLRSLEGLDHIIYSCFLIPAPEAEKGSIISDVQDAHKDLPML